MDTMKSHGVNSLMLLRGGSGCNSITGSPNVQAQPSNPAQYAVFAGAVAAHEGARGYHYYELWNEQNACWGWGDTSCGNTRPDIASYKTLLCDVYAQVHANDPQAVVMIGGLVVQNGSTWWDAITYLSTLYSLGAEGCFDAVATHPYPDNAYSSGSGGVSLLGTGSNWLYLNSTSPSIVSTMQANGDGNKPVWMTEIGCGNGGQNTVNDAADYCSEAQQAQLVNDLYNNPDSRFPNEGPILFWAYRDSTPQGQGDCTSTADAVDLCAGLIDSSGNLKPAGSTYQGVSGYW